MAAEIYKSNVNSLYKELSENKVDKTRTINSKALSDDVVLTASDIDGIVHVGGSAPSDESMIWIDTSESYTPIEGGGGTGSGGGGAVSSVNGQTGDVLLSASDVGARPDTWTPTADDVGARSNTWMPTASEVGARPDTWTPTASAIGAVPNTRKVNNKELSSDISLTASDVGARSDTWVPTAAQVGARSNTWIPTETEVISDIATIRNGAAAGATALQSYTETDPTVPDWAKAETKPTYTASEVGALPITGGIITGDTVSINKSSFSDANSGAFFHKQGYMSMRRADGFDLMYLYAKTQPATLISLPSISEQNTITLPSTSGTLALTSEIPTIADWAKAESKPTYTASEVGARSNTWLPTETEVVSDIETIRSGASLGASSYQKPSGGIPKTDLDSSVQTSLGKADTALQSYTETDPTVPSWAKADSKPTYTASEVGARADDWMPSASDVDALPISGGTLTGNVKVGGDTNYVQLETNGKLIIKRPSNNAAIYMYNGDDTAYTYIQHTHTTSNVGITLPATNGTVALTSQIPTTASDVGAIPESGAIVSGSSFSTNNRPVTGDWANRNSVEGISTSGGFLSICRDAQTNGQLAFAKKGESYITTIYGDSLASKGAHAMLKLPNTSGTILASSDVSSSGSFFTKNTSLAGYTLQNACQRKWGAMRELRLRFAMTGNSSASAVIGTIAATDIPVANAAVLCGVAYNVSGNQSRRVQVETNGNVTFFFKNSDGTGSVEASGTYTLTLIWMV